LENGLAEVGELASTNHVGTKESSALPLEDAPFMFPYLSDTKAEQCVICTPKVFVDLAWSDRVIRGALCKLVTYGRVSSESRLVFYNRADFSDMPLSLALALYFPPLAFPLNAAGHLLLSELFGTLLQPGHKGLASNLYAAYAPTHSRIVLSLETLSDANKLSAFVLSGSKSFIFHQAVI
jgi:hypothetical protein